MAEIEPVARENVRDHGLVVAARENSRTERTVTAAPVDRVGNRGDPTCPASDTGPSPSCEALHTCMMTRALKGVDALPEDKAGTLLTFTAEATPDDEEAEIKRATVVS